jgi:hypothetical protein
VTWHYVGSSHRWPVSDCRGVTSLELQRENSSSWGVVPAGICQHGPGWIEFLPAFTPQVSKAPDLMLVLHAASPGQEHVSADRPSAPTLQSRKAPCYHPQLGPQGPWGISVTKPHPNGSLGCLVEQGLLMSWSSSILVLQEAQPGSQYPGSPQSQGVPAPGALGWG